MIQIKSFLYVILACAALTFSSASEASQIPTYIGNLSTTVTYSSQFYAAVIDSSNQLGYFVANKNPSQLCKVNLGPFTQASVLVLDTNDNSMGSGALDAANNLAYFSGETSNALIVKVNTLTLTRVGSVGPTSGDTYISRTYLSAANNNLYIVCETDPTRVAQYNPSTLTRIGQVEGLSAYGESYAYSAVMNSAGTFIVTGSDGSPAVITKFNLVSNTRVGNASAISGEESFYAAVIDKNDDFAYFAAYTQPAIVVKFSVGSTVARIGALTLFEGEADYPYWSFAIDRASNTGYLPDDNGNAYIAVIDFDTFTRVGNFTVPNEYASGEYYYAAEVDSTNRRLYLGAYYNSHIYKFDIGPAPTSVPGSAGSVSAAISVAVLVVLSLLF